MCERSFIFPQHAIRYIRLYIAHILCIGHTAVSARIYPLAPCCTIHTEPFTLLLVASFSAQVAYVSLYLMFMACTARRFRPSLLLLLTFSTTTTAMSQPKVIDSHLHVWANSKESQTYPYTQAPPDSLKDAASTSSLLKHMEDCGIDGCLIVQPINHQYDHSYVINTALKEYPDKFKGMLLHDPTVEDALQRLEDLALQGFVGVRFNPYLWSESNGKAGIYMSKSTGLAVYKRCADLHMPVGIMCFKGLDLHYDDIVNLIKESPKTMLILDHFGFTNASKPDTFDLLLSLAQYPQVHVKISALFRQGFDDFEQLRTERFVPLLQKFGSDRLLWGSDFPFVLDEKVGYKESLELVAQSWIENDTDRAAIMGGTAERLFGAWGK